MLASHAMIELRRLHRFFGATRAVTRALTISGGQPAKSVEDFRQR